MNSDADLTHVLERPIKAHNEELSEITFRPPTASDILSVGNPVILDMAADPPVVTHHERKMAAMMARLANVPPSSVALMSPNDWVACAWLLTPFFVPKAGAI